MKSIYINLALAFFHHNVHVLVQQPNFFSFTKVPAQSLSHSARKPTFAFISLVVLFKFPHDSITITVNLYFRLSKKMMIIIYYSFWRTSLVEVLFEWTFSREIFSSHAWKQDSYKVSMSACNFADKCNVLWNNLNGSDIYECNVFL